MEEILEALEKEIQKTIEYQEKHPTERNDIVMALCCGLQTAQIIVKDTLEKRKMGNVLCFSGNEDDIIRRTSDIIMQTIANKNVLTNMPYCPMCGRELAE